MYLGDAVVVAVVVVAVAVVAVAVAVVVLDLDACVCCGRDSARSCNDGFRSRRLDECGVEETPNEKESTITALPKHNKNRAICAIIRRRKGEQGARRIIIMIWIDSVLS
jgi:hypothetical protein